MHELQEYLEALYGRKPYVVGIDLDGTLCKGEAWTEEEVLNAEPNTELIKMVNEKFRHCLIIIWTARSDELIPASLKWLRKHGVNFRAISNLKMGADLYVDDKTLRPNEVEEWKC